MRVFIVGGGASLRDFGFHRLDLEEVIAVNVAFYDVPRARHLIFSDIDIWPKYGKDMAAHPGTKWATEYLDVPPEVRRYKRTDEFFGESGLTCGLYGGVGTYLTGILAISLGIALKYSPIYLLGYDGDAGHYHGRYAKDKDCGLHNRFYEKFKGYDIVNLNPASTIEAFKKGNVDEFLPQHHGDNPDEKTA